MRKILIALMLIVLASAGTARADDKGETVFSRVLRTGVIRCGYIVYPPYLYKDSDTGKFSGPAYDYTQALAEELDLKVEWTEEVGWGNFNEGLSANRYDLMCVPVWQSGQRAKIALLSRPAYYNAYYAFERAGDTRFDSGLDSINNANITFAYVDGSIDQAIRKMKFPATKELSLPQSSDSAQIPLSVATKKADVALENKNNIDSFNAHTDARNRLKLAAGGKPVRLFGNCYAMKQGEFGLKNLLDPAIEAINTSGEAQMILKKYPAADFKSIAPGYSQNGE